MSALLGRIILTSVWQDTLIALFLAALQPIFRRAPVQVRYFLACAALVLMLLLPCLPQATRSSPSGPRATVADVRLPADFLPPPTARLQQTLTAASPQLALIWMFGVLAMSLRLVAGVSAGRMLIRTAVQCAPQAYLDLLDGLRTNLKIKTPVRLLVSRRIDVPAVVGWLRPVVLFPAGLCLRIPVEQVEAVLAHELFHIRRQDYIMNMVQSGVETLLFYHPAMWWVSGIIRREREHLCDDQAIAACGDAVSYARTLILIERFRASAFAPLSVSAAGSDLLARVRRIVEPRRSLSPLELLPSLLAITVLIVGAGGWRLGAQQDQDRLASPALERIVHALQGSDWRVTPQIEAGFASLRAAPLAPVVAALSHSDPGIRERAAWVLGQLGDPAAVVPLSTLLQDSAPRVAHTAAWALGRIGDASAEPSLIQALRSARGDARSGAAWALGAIRSASAVRPLIDALSDSDPDVRCAVAWALGRIGDRSALTALLGASRDPGSDVREKVREAISRLSGR
jgi:beta-lactamase regulating signal transducer with metallopeptidase domain